MLYLQLAGKTLGQYQVDDLIAKEAGIIATYKARQPALNRAVAIQVLNPDLPDDSLYRNGFLSSAQIMAQLEHPHILPIHDADVADDLAFIVLRLVTGGSLRQRLKAGVLPLGEVVAVVTQIGNALDFAHAQGVTHGDPSVANIAFDAWGSAYISDFHVAGIQNQTNALIGTPIYMAPERWSANKPTPSSDQYALGCIAYHMLTGQPPFEGEGIALVFQHETKIPEPVANLRADVPRTVNHVFERVLAKKPADRYPSVTEFARALEQALRDTPKHVFISYSHEDTPYVQQLITQLDEHRFHVWMDESIEYGDTWFREIENAIGNCAALLLVMTPTSAQSEWVQKEILLAKRHQKPIFPLLLAGQEFAIVIDLQFADVRGAKMPAPDFYHRLRRAVYGD